MEIKANTQLPGSKIIMAEDYTSPNGVVMPAGLMLSIRSLELTFHKKNIKMLAIKSKKIIDKLYDGIEGDYYQTRWGNKFYEFSHDNLQHFLDNANFVDANELYKTITEHF